jgi:hypothetical protein
VCSGQFAGEPQCAAQHAGGRQSPVSRAAREAESGGSGGTATSCRPGTCRIKSAKAGTMGSQSYYQEVDRNCEMERERERESRRDCGSEGLWDGEGGADWVADARRRSALVRDWHPTRDHGHQQQPKTRKSERQFPPIFPAPSQSQLNKPLSPSNRLAHALLPKPPPPPASCGKGSGSVPSGTIRVRTHDPIRAGQRKDAEAQLEARRATTMGAGRHPW